MTSVSQVIFFRAPSLGIPKAYCKYYKVAQVPESYFFIVGGRRFEFSATQMFRQLDRWIEQIESYDPLSLLPRIIAHLNLSLSDSKQDKYFEYLNYLAWRIVLNERKSSLIKRATDLYFS